MAANDMHDSLRERLLRLLAFLRWLVLGACAVELVRGIQADSYRLFLLDVLVLLALLFFGFGVSLLHRSFLVGFTVGAVIAVVTFHIGTLEPHAEGTELGSHLARLVRSVYHRSFDHKTLASETWRFEHCSCPECFAKHAEGRCCHYVCTARATIGVVAGLACGLSAYCIGRAALGGQKRCREPGRKGVGNAL